MSRTPDFDIIVIGGGIQGAGVAQAAAAAGYRVLVIEREALAAHTSSRSSKLIHGGLRYLETAQLGLVRESLRERGILLRLAPELVRLRPFFIPVYDDSRRGSFKIRAGLSLYALLGGLGPENRFRALPQAEWPAEDGLKTTGLRAVFRYLDAQTDDARMTRAVMRSAQELGAVLACPATFLGAERTDAGYRIELDESGGIRELSTRTVVNAAGPWVNAVLEHVVPAPPPLQIELVQGAHIVLAQPTRAGVYYTESPRDHRAVFVMPWQGETLVGTTETSFRGDPTDAAPTPEEERYLLEAYSHHFPERATLIQERFAGLRVLPGGAGRFSSRQRETLIVPDAPSDPRLVSIAGGKFTTYRATALKALRRIRSVLPPTRPLADTARLPLTDPVESRPPSPSRK